MARIKGQLTAKQQRFVSEYLIDLNATQAAMRAGYSKRTANEQGAQLLAKLSIQKLVASAMQRRDRRTEVTQDRVIAEFAKIGFADIRKAVAWGSAVPITDPETGEVSISNGVALIGSDVVDDATAASIAEISKTRDGLRVKMHDKQAALVSLARHLGLFNDKVQHTGTLTLEGLLAKIGR